MTEDLAAKMIERFDHHHPELARDGVPRQIYQQMREQCPVAWTEAHGGFWVATRYEDIERVGRDSETFGSSKGIMIPDPQDALPPDLQQQMWESRKGIGAPVTYDPPAHTPIRRALDPLFAPHVVRARKNYIRSVADGWIDTFIESGSCDAVADYCAPVPTIVVLNWLGLPEEDWKSWSDAVLNQFSSPSEAGIDLTAIDHEKLLHTIQLRRQQPVDDVISALCQLQIDGAPLRDFDLLMVLVQLVFAGLDTTTNTVASTLVELHRRPALRDQLASTPDGDRLWNSAIEEFLRFVCPIQGFKRTARVATKVGEQAVAPDERVFIVWASANFDDSVFADPDEIDIRRTPNPHMTFGRGIHRCLGSHLARLEVEVMLQQLLRRLPDYTVDESALQIHRDVGVAYGYDAVPLSFTPGPRTTGSPEAAAASRSAGEQTPEGHSDGTA
jgi:cytochrome P450